MALIKCIDCGNEVSTAAKACPKCGRPTPIPVMPPTQAVNEPKPFPRGAVQVAVGVILIILVAAAVSSMIKAHKAQYLSDPIRPAAEAAVDNDRQDQLEWEADAAAASREVRIEKVFIARSNAIDECVEKRGGVHLAPFGFGNELSIAYRMQIGDDALAQRFLKYIDKTSACTPFSGDDLERGLLPALPHLRNTGEIGTLVALVGDMCARKADSSARCFAGGVIALMTAMHVR